MGKSIFDKIWDAHVVKSVGTNLDVLFIDRHFVHEVTSPQAFAGLEAREAKVLFPERVVATVDHNIPTKDQHLPIEDPLSKGQVDTLLENCKNHGITCFEMGNSRQGIVHVIGPEQGFTLPGSTIVCGDSHTSTHGAFGTIAFGIGTSQVEQVLATQCLVLHRPKTMKVVVNGPLAKGVTAKDVVLYIISRLGTEGATGHFIEYAGTTIESLSMEGRMTVCNMSIEMGARGGLIGVDQVTTDYLHGRGDLDLQSSEGKHLVEAWKSLNSDPEATFDQVYQFDAADIRPMVTCGTSPDTGIFIDQKVSESAHISSRSLTYMGFDDQQTMAQEKVDYVFIGSCTNGRIEDLRMAAELIKGRKKASHVHAWVVPGSQEVMKKAIHEGLDKIFQEAGFEFRQPGCSACLAMNSDKIPPGALCVSTSNRNFEGRQGPGSRTVLASPLTAAASAVVGHVATPELFLS